MQTLPSFPTIRYRTNQLENVRAGSTAIVDLPIGPSYVHLDLVFRGSGLTVADFTEIRVKMNGDVKHRYSGPQLNAINKRRGLVDGDVAKRLLIPFTRRGLKLPASEMLTALFTGSADTNGRAIMKLELEVDIAQNATNPQLELFARQGDNIQGGPGLVLQYVRDTVDANFVGEKSIGNLVQRGDTSRLYANTHHLFVSETALSRVRVRRNGLDIFDYTPTDIVIEEQEYAFDANHPNLVVIDPTIQGYGSNFFNLENLNDYRILLEMATATPSLDIISEYVGAAF